MAVSVQCPDPFAKVQARVHAVCAALAVDGVLPTGIDLARVAVEPTHEACHGEMVTNAALVLAKDAKAGPRDLAEAIAVRLRADDLIASVDVAGPGFVNVTLSPSAWAAALRAVLREGDAHGRDPVGAGEKLTVEYVSANLTGPMHASHCRGAVFGDALSSLLTFAGYDITREYYVSDAGAPVDVLARSAFRVATSGKAAPDAKIVQPVKLLRNGEPVTMSERSGDFITLREVVDEVGCDAVRFMMLFCKNDAVLDFDLAKVIEQSKDNAVFYVQYGHARGCSVFRNAREAVPGLPETVAGRAEFLADAPLERLDDTAELGLIRRLVLYPRMIESAAIAHEPHRIAFYLHDLASEFHALWIRGRDSPHLRFIITNDAEITKARLAMVQGVVWVLASGLAILGVRAPDEMR
jgi:arginyl-tRNA synthetase